MILRLVTCPSMKTPRTQKMTGLCENATSPQKFQLPLFGQLISCCLVRKFSLYLNVKCLLCFVLGEEMSEVYSHIGILYFTFPADFFSEVVLAFCAFGSGLVSYAQRQALEVRDMALSPNPPSGKS